jgi:hypothetical protein
MMQPPLHRCWSLPRLPPILGECVQVRVVWWASVTPGVM